MNDDHLTSGGESTEQPATTAQVEAPAPSPTPEPPAQPAPPTPPAPVTVADDTAAFEAALDAFANETEEPGGDTVRRLSKGQLLTAKVIQVDKDRAFVDLGTKAEGIIPLEELSTGEVEDAREIVKIGDEIRVVVVHPDKGGSPIVSKKRADFESTWDRLVDDFKENKTISAVVVDRVKGGLEVDLGVRGFVPASHVSSGKSRNLDRFVGQSINLKIIDVDPNRRKVVLSNRLAEDENRESRKQKLFESVKPGDILEGTVRRLVDYGAFVDLGGVDGLLHVSEISWSRVDHPKEVLKEGDDVKVMVLRLDSGTGRISLGRRQVLPDPWAEVRGVYTVGQRLALPISRVVQSGAFVKLPEDAEAFIPASEMSHQRGKKPSELVEPGQTVEVQIIDLRPDERRMVLSMRALLPFEDRPQRTERHRQRDNRQTQDTGARGATIGERLGALKGFASSDQDAEDEAPIEASEASSGAPAESAPEAPVAEAAPETAPAPAPTPEPAAEG